MFFVYRQKSKKVDEFKDLASLLALYSESELQTTKDLFWTLSLKSWIPVPQAISESTLKKKKYQIPSLPVENLNPNLDHDESATLDDDQTQNSVPNPLAEAVTNPLIQRPDLGEQDFVIVSFEKPTPASKGASQTENRNAAETQNEKPSANQSGKKKDFSEQRGAPRRQVRMKVIISNKEKTFLSYTVNVSTTGVMLEDKIPRDYFNSETEIFISSPKKNEFVAFRCTPAGDEKEPNRFSFGTISEANLEKFKDWIGKFE